MYVSFMAFYRFLTDFFRRLKLASTCGGGSSSGHHNQVVCLATEDTANLNQWVQAIKLSSMAPDIEVYWQLVLDFSPWVF